MGLVRRISFDVIAQGGNVQRIFVRGVGFRFSHRLRRTYDFLDVVLVLAVMFIVVLFVFVLARFLHPFVLFVQLVFVVFILFDFRRRTFVYGLFLFVSFIFFKDRSAGGGSRGNFLANQILFGFDYAGGKQFGFFLADVHVRSCFRFGRCEAQSSLFLFLLGFRCCSAANFVCQVLGYRLVRFG